MWCAANTISISLTNCYLCAMNVIQGNVCQLEDLAELEICDKDILIT